MNKNYLIIFLSLLLIITSCKSSDKSNPEKNNNIIEMTIEPETGSFYGINPRHPIECMLVKIKGSSEIKQIRMNDIKNFKYEKGYEWKIEVKADTLKNPPADKSAIEYTLIKVTSKKKQKSAS